MPLAIAVRGRLKEAGSLADLVDVVKTKAELRGWLSAEAPPVDLAASRVRALDGSVSPPRPLRLRGIWVNPHFASDDLGLVFDLIGADLVDPSRLEGGNGNPVANGFGLTRTTFADAATHVALLDLLEDLADRDLASFEIGDPTGRELPRDLAAAETRQREARAEAFRAALERPGAPPLRFGGLAELARLPAERDQSTGPLDLLDEKDRGLLLRTRERFLAAWLPEAPGLDGDPETAVRTLERLTDLLLSHPAHRHQPEYLERTFSAESGIALGFSLVEALGGVWERARDADGGAGRLRVSRLGGVGLSWDPLRSARERLHAGTLFAHDGVLRWLRVMAGVAREASPA